MDPASALLRSLANGLVYRAHSAMGVAADPRRSVRRLAMQPGSFDADWTTMLAHLVDDHGVLGQRLAQFLRMRRFLDDAPMPRASRAAAANWMLVIAHELGATRGLVVSLLGNDADWRGFLAPLDRARDMRLQLGLIAALTQQTPQLMDARKRGRET